MKNLTEKGKFLGGNALQPVTTATSVRVRQGEVLMSDGPFAETKEQLAGFYLLDAQDLNEAVQLASKIPPAALGTIEIRPVRELPPKDPDA
ncbi:MAG: YciI family protein [Marinobacter sp.]|nr:YciI family protein [Marinobacter sp.]